MNNLGGKMTLQFSPPQELHIFHPYRDPNIKFLSYNNLDLQCTNDHDLIQ